MAQKKWPSGYPGIYRLEDKPNNKCRLWRLIVTITFKDGRKPRQYAENFAGTLTEAIEARLRLKQKHSSDEIPEAPESWTFDAYKEKFLKRREEDGEIASGTLKRDRYNLNAMSFCIGTMQMADVTTKVLETALKDLRSGKSPSGKRLSGTYLNDVMLKVSLMMDMAVDDKVIVANPCDKVKYPKLDTAPKRALAEEAVLELLSLLNPVEPMELGIALCVTMGLRRQEAIGLSWGDINFKKRTIHIAHGNSEEGKQKDTKTPAGDRYLPMSQYIYDALQNRYAVQFALLEQYGTDLLTIKRRSSKKTIADDVPVLCDKWGNRFKPHSLTRWWERHRALYGLNDWTLHELRHTFLTLAAEKGVHPSVMQQLAGHKTSRTSLEIYTHVNMDAKRAAMDVIGSIFDVTKPGDGSEDSSESEDELRKVS